MAVGVLAGVAVGVGANCILMAVGFVGVIVGIIATAGAIRLAVTRLSLVDDVCSMDALAGGLSVFVIGAVANVFCVGCSSVG